jgi:hypothetical protein
MEPFRAQRKAARTKDMDVGLSSQGKKKKNEEREGTLAVAWHFF